MDKLREKYEKFAKAPIDNLEIMAFTNLAQCEDAHLAMGYMQILLEIQKVKKDNTSKATNENVLSQDDSKKTS